MALTLQEVKDSIDSGNIKTDEVRKEVAKVGSYFKRYFDGLKNKKGDELEAAREKKAAKSSIIERISNSAKEKTSGFGLPGLLPAAALGIPAALTGLRGTELPILKGLGKGLNKIASGLKNSIKGLGNALKRLGNGLKRLSRSLGRLANRSLKPIRSALRRILNRPLSALRKIGSNIDDFLKGSKVGNAISNAIKSIIRAPVNALSKVKSAPSDLLDTINNAAKNVRTSLLRLVGIGPDGKLLSLRDVDTGKFKRNNIGRAFQQIGQILDSLTDFAKGVAASAAKFGFGAVAGAAKGAAGAAKGAAGLLASGAGGALKLIGKILWPVGILFALYDGFEAYRNSEGDQADKIAAGVSGFIGDLVGAPLNLLKDIVSWTLAEMGFEKASEFLDGLNIEQALKDTLNTIWGWFRKSLRWIGTLLTDPLEALNQLWTGFLGGAASLTEWIWNTGIKPLGSWIMSLLDISFPEINFSEVIKDVGNKISNWFYDLVDYIWKKIKALNPFSSENDDGKPMEAPSGVVGADGDISRYMTAPKPSDPYQQFYGGGISGLYGQDGTSKGKSISEMQREIEDFMGSSKGVNVDASSINTDARTSVQNNTIQAADTPNPIDSGLGIKGLE